MLNTILSKRVKALTLVLVLSMLLTAATALAATKYIRARKGGTINIARGVKLVIRPGALEEDTLISADMLERRKRIYFRFEPEGLEFSKPAELRISWQAIDGVKDLTLYGEGGLKIEPVIRGWGVKYYIDHFSLYYYRRR